MRKLQKLLALLGFILVAAHLTCLPGFASTQGDSKSVTQAAKKASSEKIASGQIRLPGHVPAAIQGAAPLPAAPGSGSEPITLTIILKRTDQSGFDKFLLDVYDPNSPIYHHFLKPVEISDNFGPTREVYDQVLQYLSAKGFKLVEESANRLTLTVKGTRAQAESAFALHIGEYWLGDRKVYSNDMDPAVPTRIASSIHAVAGLSDVARPQANNTALFNVWVRVCKQLAALEFDYAGMKNKWLPGLTCPTLDPKAWWYNNGQDPPGLRNNNGTGQTVGLIEFDTFLMSDVADYIALIGSPPTLIGNVSEVKVNGGAPPGANQDEVLLDIDSVLTIAPGAKVVVYDAPFTGPGSSFQALFNAAINGGSTIISNSWAYCENQTTPADVNSIDAIFKTAAGAGISIFNGSGDTGSTCLDGSANTAAVPADSPNATAVGGSSISGGPGDTYGPETWWDGSASTPRTGQGGFGVSKFFPVPSYQVGLTSSTMRSVPDVVASADPASGVILCQASTGGCPNGLLYGGTSIAAPEWAAFTAVLNEALGHNVGAFNQAVYPFANTTVFHNATALASDFAHVGLGSPNLSLLYQKLGGITVGTPDAAFSLVVPFIETSLTSSPAVVYADGTSQGFVNVALLDANGNPVPGKTVALSANAGSHVQISPATAVTTVDNGVATFTLIDLTAETLTLTATDTTDNIVLTKTGTLIFIVPPPTAASLNVSPLPPSTVPADGVSTATITIAMQDSLGRPTPGKLVTLNQVGHSVISGPNPSLTDANGQIVFTSVDQFPEAVTYSATDVTDGSLAVPASGTVTFTGGPANGCGNGNPIAAPGFLATPYATGFLSQNFFYGNVNFSGCPGAFGVAFDGPGNLYVSDAPTGNIYKFPPGGGVAGATTLLSAGVATPSAGLGPSVGGLAIDKNGNLFAGRAATTGNFFTGAVLKVDTTTGAVSTVAGTGPSGIVGGLALTCPEAVVIDPLTDDLFTDDSCGGGGSDNAAMWRVSNPTGAPATSVYTTFPGTPNATIAAAPSGTFYVWNVTGSSVTIQKVSGTNGPATPTVTTVANLPLSIGFLGLLAGGTQANGDATFLVYNYFIGSTSGIAIVDLTTNPPSTRDVLVSGGVVNNNNLAFGTDGCIYAALGNGVFKITDTAGACNYTAGNPGPAISLAPASISPSPAQGTSETFTATFHDVTAPTGVPMIFQVTGANPQMKMVKADANGHASFSYTAANAGADTVLAFATINSSTVTSNPVEFTWTSGAHLTFLTLNQSPTAGTVNTSVTLTASLTDLSVNPPAPLADESVSLSLDGDTCIGTTDGSGNASCAVTPTAIGPGTITASFAGITGQYLASSATKGFTVSGQVANLSYTGPTTFANGGTAALSATLTTAANTPISGEIINFSLGSGAGAQTCSGTTDTTGTASCNIASVNQPVGAGMLTSAFPGDLTYQGTSAPTSVTINTAQVTVPNVVGLTQAAASTAITGAGLVVGTVTTASSSTVPAGSVISQNPTSGTLVAPGSAVNLVVSTGPAQVTVPNVVGLTQGAASTAITGAGLVVGTVTTASSSTVPAGSVISQNPTSGTLVAPGSAVNLVVSTGSAQVTVPNVVGLTQGAASTAITGAGLVVGTVTTASSSTVPAGSVISQNPTSGTLVAPGSKVNLVVSTGPAKVAVPNVVGLTQSAASTAIKGAGLVVGTVTTASSSTVPAGSVISQNPTSGTLVAPGSAVNLVVSSGPASAGKPEICGHIIAKGKGPSGTLFVDLKLTDTGKGDAVNVQIGQLALRTLCGSGKVTYNAALSGPLPLKVGNIKKGASATVRLFFNVPSKVTGFSITENGTMQDTVGKNYNYSTSQTVTLCREWDGPGRFGDCDHDDCGNKCDHDDCDHCDRF